MKLVVSCLFILPVIFSLVGCSIATERSDNVSQGRIYQHYSAIYSQSTNATRVTAEFRFGDGSGTTLELTGKSDVKHSTYPLSRTQFVGTYYSGSGTGFVENHIFTYTNEDGTVFNNYAHITPIAFKNLPGSFSSSADLFIEWDGPTLEKDEEVMVTLSDDNDVTTFSTYTPGTRWVTVPKENFAGFSSGQKKISLTRSRMNPLQKATEVGGFFSTAYESEKMPILFR